VDHWWGGDGSPNDDLLADLKAYGADVSALPERMQKPSEFEVWPEHEDAVLLFLRCQTQWRATSGGVMGLDYGVVLQLMDLYAVSRRRDVLEDLQIMEGRARELINKAAEPKKAAGRKG
jgi:hypothetical protein